MHKYGLCRNCLIFHFHAFCETPILIQRNRRKSVYTDLCIAVRWNNFPTSLSLYTSYRAICRNVEQRLPPDNWARRNISFVSKIVIDIIIIIVFYRNMTTIIKITTVELHRKRAHVVSWLAYKFSFQRVQNSILTADT